MKKGRFLWSAHRITERQKAGKARSIKGKQLKNSRSTVSKPHVVLHSSPSANRYQIWITIPRTLWFWGFFVFRKGTCFTAKHWWLDEFALDIFDWYNKEY